MTESSVDYDAVEKPTPPNATSHRPPDRLTLDVFRGVVCLGVVFMHLIFGLGEAGVTAAVGEWLPFVTTYLRLGVESFFVLGGYFWAYKTRPAENYLSVTGLLGRRLIRLAVPYWVAVLLAAAFAWGPHLVFDRGTKPPGWGELVPVLTFSQDIFGERWAVLFTLWSMAPLLQFYFGMTVVYWVFRRVALAAFPGRYKGVTHRLMVYTMLAALLTSGAIVAWDLDGEWQLPRVVWAFALGALVYWWVVRQVSSRLLLVACAWVLATGFAGGEGVWQSKAVAAVGIIAAIGRGLTVPNVAATRWLGEIGLRSYSLYLVHGLFGMRFVYWSHELPNEDVVGRFAYFLAGFAASLLSGFAFYSLIERPTRRWARSIDYRA